MSSFAVFIGKTFWIFRYKHKKWYDFEKKRKKGVDFAKVL